MQDYFTLFYCFSDFQDKVEGIIFDGGKYQPETSITNMDFNPSEQSVKNVLNFARSYEVLKTESAGYVEMNLN